MPAVWKPKPDTQVSHHARNCEIYTQLPFVSLAPLLGWRPPTRLSNATATDPDWIATATRLDAALGSLGFVYLTDHGIPEDKIQAAFKESMSFFNLNEDFKMIFERDFETTFHGYTRSGGIITPEGVSAEYRESFDSALCTANSFKSKCPYPDEQVPSFRPAMEDLMTECRVLSQKLLKLIGLGLGLADPDTLLANHSNLEEPTIASYCQLKTLHYPGLTAAQAGVVNATRQAAHTDYGTLTLLMQNGVGGLEVQLPSPLHKPAFLKADPVPGCILVNVGDLLHVWSGGRYPSTVHRVVIPSDGTTHTIPRQSIAAFIKPNNDTVVECLPECLQFCDNLGRIPVDGVADENSTHKDEKLHLSTGTANAGEHFRRRTIAYHD